MRSKTYIEDETREKGIQHYCFERGKEKKTKRERTSARLSLPQ